MTTGLQPLTIINHGDNGMLEIAWSDGVTGMVDHRLLREACRCAHCVAATRSGKSIKSKNDIRLTMIEPYGNNTLHLGFDDGHQRGLYPFDYLRALESAG